MLSNWSFGINWNAILFNLLFPLLPASLSWIMFCFQMLHNTMLSTSGCHRGSELSAQWPLLLQRTWQNSSHLVADTFLCQAQVKNPDLQTCLVVLNALQCFEINFPAVVSPTNLNWPFLFISLNTLQVFSLCFLEPFKSSSLTTLVLYYGVPRKYRCPK